MSAPGRNAAQAGIGLLIVLAAAVSWRYTGVEGPHALVLVAAVAAWLALFTLAALGLGAPVWRAVSGEPLRGTEAWVVSAAAGAAALAAVAGLLGASGLLRPWLLLAVLGAAALAGAVVLRRAAPAVDKIVPPPLPALLLAFAAAVTLLAVATPSPFYDQVHYHLAFPERWLRAGTIEVFPRHSYSYLAANMSLLYTYALAGPGAWGAQAIHWWCGVLAVGGAFVTARKIGAGATGAWWAVAFVAVTPSFVLCSTWAASDLGVAAFGAVACGMALDAAPPARARGAGWYALAGVLCGAAFGAKYVGLTAVILPVGLILVGALLLGARGGFPPAMSAGRLLAWCAGIAAAALPWAARNVWLTGNPLYPFLASLFSRFVPDAALEGMARAAEGIAGQGGGGSWLTTLTLRTFDPIGAAGWIGPLWLTLLPLWALSALTRRERRSQLLAVGVAAGIAAWTQFHQLGRYLLPVLVLAAPGVGLVWERLLAAVGGTLRRAAIALVVFLALWGLQGGLSESLFLRIACTFGRAETRELLERYVTYWSALPQIDEQLPADAKLLMVGEPRVFGIERDVVVEDAFRTPYLLEVARTADSAPAMAETLRRSGVTHVLYNEQEAARIARIRGLSGYFGEAAPAEAARLSEFLSRCLEPLAAPRASPVHVYRLRQSCGAEAPAG